MRLAALYDIHGNLPALEAVLAELAADPPDAVIVGGDVAAGPQPVEVLRRLEALPWPVHRLRGNADRWLVRAYDGTIPADLLEHPIFVADTWTAQRISRADRDHLAALPPALELDGVSFCHATPRSDEERVTVFTPDARIAELVALAPTSLVVAGHTHRQFDRAAGGGGGGRMVNAGSVGRPYEPEPAAYWLRLDPEVRLMRTDYDTEAATAAFHALGYPMADGMVTPVDADAVARKYEAMAGEPTSPESQAGLAPVSSDGTGGGEC
jgi:predicted phosphodiesterase